MTTEPGFHSTLKAADLCIYVGEQGATLSTILFLFIYMKNKERVTDLWRSQCRSAAVENNPSNPPGE